VASIVIFGKVADLLTGWLSALDNTSEDQPISQAPAPFHVIARG
jgi:hypothetical protein